MNTWDLVWEFAVDHYIFHTVAFIFLAIFVFGGKGHFKAGIGKTGFTFERMGDPVDPKAPCPYNLPHPELQAAIKANTKMINTLNLLVQETAVMHDKIKNDVIELHIYDLKASFWNEAQPLQERMMDGLEYVHLKRNGITKSAVNKMAKMYPEIYKGITVGRKELKLEELESGEGYS